MLSWAPCFIAPDGDSDPARVVRMRAALAPAISGDTIVSAVLRLTALGVVEARLDGARIGSSVLTPGWSSYQWRLRYAEHDLDPHLLNAGSVLELDLGAGWYAGRLGFYGSRGLYGERAAAAAELTITYADGSTRVVVTDESWEWAPSPSIRADLYDGQDIDARVGDPATWRAVTTVPTPAASIEPYVGPPIERQEYLEPLRIWYSPSGRLLIDFGQNLVGWLRLSVHGSRGSTIVARHAEVLEGGELAVRPLRTARATDTFILSGGPDVFEPTFTFHGFRYAEITGWTGSTAELHDALRAVVIGSSMRRIGRFSSSHPQLNRFHDNVVWGMRGNFVDVPTDCPQRDERLGWTGDLAVFAPTAVFLFDAQDFLTDWMLDLTAETEHTGGVVPFVVPNMFALERGAESDPVLGSPFPTAVWGDAAVWVPWALFQHDGDKARLGRLYRAMTLHGEAVARVLSADGVWDRGFQFGDWLDPLAPPDDPAASRTPPTLVATASGYRTFGILASAADILGHEADAERWRSIATRVRAGFRSHYVHNGALQIETETAYALAIVFGLLTEGERDTAGARLAALVRANGHRISTGFAGTAYLTEALSESGYVDDAYALLLQTECPSWLYQVEMGATTVWERWDSMLPDGSVNPGEMTSFNHYALGSVADWMHRTVGGIAPLEPGYRRVLIAPRPGPGLEWCETSIELPSGPVRVRWRVVGDLVALTVDTAAPAVVRWRDLADIELPPGHHELTLSR